MVAPHTTQAESVPPLQELLATEREEPGGHGGNQAALGAGRTKISRFCLTRSQPFGYNPLNTSKGSRHAGQATPDDRAREQKQGQLPQKRLPVTFYRRQPCTEAAEL